MFIFFFSMYYSLSQNNKKNIFEIHFPSLSCLLQHEIKKGGILNDKKIFRYNF